MTKCRGCAHDEIDHYEAYDGRAACDGLGSIECADSACTLHGTDADDPVHEHAVCPCRTMPRDGEYGAS